VDNITASLVFTLYVSFVLFAYLGYVFLFSHIGLVTRLSSGSYLQFITALIFILLVSVLFSYLAILVGNEIDGSMDRSRYLDRFLNQGRMRSYGLDFLASTVRGYGGGKDSFLFIASFVSIFIFQLAFILSRYANSYGYLILLLSGIPLTFFYLLKQGPAIAFSTLAIILFIESSGWLRRLVAIISIIFSILFHLTAIVVPIVLLTAFLMKYTHVRIVVYATLIIFFIFVDSFISIVALYSPTFAIFVESYITRGFNGGYFFAIFKYLPFYILSGYLFLKRVKLRERFRNFDYYFFLSVIISLFCILSYKMYWFFRVSLYFYLPAILFCFYILRFDFSFRVKWFIRSFSALWFGLISFRYLAIILFDKGGF
jgi:hypothetical protein